MNSSSLTPSSYIVLGTTALCGPLTSYELNQRVESSVGHFWTFSRTKLYSEPDRLTTLGLLSATQEETGRRRRTYAITEEGRAVITSWLQEETDASTELRDPGLLKLFFSSLGSAEDVQDLARRQAAAHRRKLGEYERISESIADDPRWVFNAAALRMGISFEQTAAQFWEDIMQRSIGETSNNSES